MNSIRDIDIDGKRVLILTSNNFYKIFNTDNGQIIDSISQKDYKFYWNPVLEKIEHSQKVNYNLNWSPHGNYYYKHQGDSMYIWDSETNQLQLRISTKQMYIPVVWSPDDMFLLSTEVFDKFILLRDIARKNHVMKLQGHTEWVYDAYFLPENSTILTCSKKNTTNEC